MDLEKPNKCSNSMRANFAALGDGLEKPNPICPNGACIVEDFLALDIETECAIESCDKKGCDHALYPAQANITCIGIYTPTLQFVFRGPYNIRDFQIFYDQLADRVRITGHNLKFDLKFLRFNGFRWRSIEQVYGHDSQVLASVLTEKVPEKYLTKYEGWRKTANKKLPRGFSHRLGSPLSLKVLAPFFLSVKPFWEDPTNHDNDEYVLKDCEYTWKCTELFSSKVKSLGLYDFYEKRLMPWVRMLMEAEIEGISLDLGLLDVKEAEAIEQAACLKIELDGTWAEAYEAYYHKQVNELCDHYHVKLTTAEAKLKNPSQEKREKLAGRYHALLDAAVEKLPRAINLDSPTQLTWLLKDYLGLDIKDFNDDESTGKEVLQRLSATGRDDIKSFLEYRKAKKLATAFFPSYREMHVKGVLHTSFNATGTRTGRLSSNGPNLQQVPGHLHNLFTARPGHRLITRDLASIEPRVAAFYTEDPLLCNLIINDGDFHSQNAIIMFGLPCQEAEVKTLYPAERFVAKTCGLALMYGAREFRIQATAMQRGFQWEIDHCQEIYQNFREAYETAFAFKENLDAMALAGDPVVNLFGRAHSYRGLPRGYVGMRVFNTLVQSTASDLLLYSTHSAKSEMKEKGIAAKPLLWVHDETVWEVPEDRTVECEEIIERHLTKHKLETQFGLIPLKCEGKTERYWAK